MDPRIIWPIAYILLGVLFAAAVDRPTLVRGDDGILAFNVFFWPISLFTVALLVVLSLVYLFFKKLEREIRILAKTVRDRIGRF